jgi:hypothetical protein
MEGATLAEIAVELGQTTGDILERRVAAALGPTLPTPTLLPLGDPDRPALLGIGFLSPGESSFM